MQDSLNTPKKRPIACKCGCGNKFSPTKHGQVFINPEHRKAHWSRIQNLTAAQDYEKFLQVRDKFLRYLKHENRINAWLKANKK